MRSFGFDKDKIVAPGELSQRQLTGRGLPGNKGVHDLLLAKRELMRVWVEKAKSLTLGKKVIDRLEKWRDGGHRAFRQDMGVMAGEVSTQWLSTFGTHVQNFFKMVDGSVFGLFQDALIKQHKLNGDKMDERLGKHPFKEKLLKNRGGHYETYYI